MCWGIFWINLSNESQEQGPLILKPGTQCPLDSPYLHLFLISACLSFSLNFTSFISATGRPFPQAREHDLQQVLIPILSRETSLKVFPSPWVCQPKLRKDCPALFGAHAYTWTISTIGKKTGSHAHRGVDALFKIFLNNCIIIMRLACRSSWTGERWEALKSGSSARITMYSDESLTRGRDWETERKWQRREARER